MNTNTYIPFHLETGRGTRLNYIFQKSAAGSRARSENPFDPLTPLRFSDTSQLQIRFNPPFTGSVFQEEISKDLLALCKTKKTEILFLALFIKMLKVGGRCASIVPDGVLFGSSTAHKALRKELVENQQLHAVISMPSGVFKPYAGVSTAILIFTKTNSGGTDQVWFYDMKSDGFSLDDKRTPLQQSDIPDIIVRYQNLEGEKARERTAQSFFVPKQEIVDNVYDLSINKYMNVVFFQKTVTLLIL